MGWFAGAGTLGLIVEYFLKTTVVLTPAILVSAASKRRPAAFRHFVLSFALAGLLLLPLLSLAPLGWRTSLLPARPAPADISRKADVSTPRLEVAGIPAPALSTSAGRAPDVSSFPRELSRETQDGAAAASTGPSIPAALTPRESGATNSRNTRILDLALAAVWSCGLGLLILRIALGLAGAARLTREGTALGGPVWRTLLDRFRSLVALKRPVRLKGHPRVFVPLTWGWRRPVILMPSDTDSWTAEERSSALFHELSHVKRADFLALLAVRASLAVFWFNPLCWIVYRELRKEQEIACDELVLRAGIRPSTYAASLLAFRRSAGFRLNQSSALLGMLGNASFNERLAAILKQKLALKEVMMKTRITLAAALVLAVTMIGTARPAVRTENSDTPMIDETPVPAPAPVSVFEPAVSVREKAAAQKKEKEKEKKITIEAAKGKEAPVVITITQGDEVKTLTLAGPLTITSLKDGGALVLSSEGKEIQVLKGEPLRLEIKSGEVQLIKEGKALKVGEGGVYTIVREGGKDGHKIVFYGTAEGKKPEPGTYHIVKKDDPSFTWTVEEPGRDGVYWMSKEFSAKPGSTAFWVGEGGKAFAFAPSGTKEMLEKIRALREQVEAVKAKKMDLAALEESLKKLESELQAKEAKHKELEVKFEKIPKEGGVAKIIGEDEARGRVGIWVSEGDKAKAITEVKEKGDSAIRIILGGRGTSREDYDRIAAKLKKELPEGCTLLDQEFDQESGIMSFKITSMEGQKVDSTIVRKLADILKDEVKAKK